MRARHSFLRCLQLVLCQKMLQKASLFVSAFPLRSFTLFSPMQTALERRASLLGRRRRAKAVPTSPCARLASPGHRTQVRRTHAHASRAGFRIDRVPDERVILTLHNIVSQQTLLKQRIEIPTALIVQLKYIHSIRHCLPVRQRSFDCVSSMVVMSLCLLKLIVTHTRITQEPSSRGASSQTPHVPCRCGSTLYRACTASHHVQWGRYQEQLGRVVYLGGGLLGF